MMEALKELQDADRPKDMWNDLPDDVNENGRRLFVATNPWYKKYTVPRSALVDINGGNRFRYFFRRCPICGKRISGRPAEYPYYRKFGLRFVYLCDMCDGLKNVSIQD